MSLTLVRTALLLFGSKTAMENGGHSNFPLASPFCGKVAFQEHLGSALQCKMQMCYWILSSVASARMKALNGCKCWICTINQDHPNFTDSVPHCITPGLPTLSLRHSVQEPGHWIVWAVKHGQSICQIGVADDHTLDIDQF